MNKRKAIQILSGRNAIVADGLSNGGMYLWWQHGDEEAVLDGRFGAEELEAIAWWMRNGARIPVTEFTWEIPS